MLSFNYGDGTLAYRKTGTGRKTMLLFHGFGQNNDCFRSWESELSPAFTTYHFDLYYHGESSRPDKYLKVNDWHEVMCAFFASEKIDRFSIGAFSLGGRFAITLVFLFYTRIENLILVAPDGIYRSPWYTIATTVPTKWLFRYFINHPNGFLRFIATIGKTGLLNASLLRFVQRELSDVTNMKRVYRSWVYFKPLLYPQPAIAAVMKLTNANIHVVLGEKDLIIPRQHVSPTFRKSEVLLLNCRHDKLVDQAEVHNLLKNLSPP